MTTDYVLSSKIPHGGIVVYIIITIFISPIVQIWELKAKLKNISWCG